jgi:hypothetical protein
MALEENGLATPPDGYWEQMCWRVFHGTDKDEVGANARFFAACFRLKAVRDLELPDNRVVDLLEDSEKGNGGELALTADHRSDIYSKPLRVTSRQLVEELKFGKSKEVRLFFGLFNLRSENARWVLSNIVSRILNKATADVFHLGPSGGKMSDTERLDSLKAILAHFAPWLQKPSGVSYILDRSEEWRGYPEAMGIFKDALPKPRNGSFRADLEAMVHGDNPHSSREPEERRGTVSVPRKDAQVSLRELPSSEVSTVSTSLL